MAILARFDVARNSTGCGSTSISEVEGEIKEVQLLTSSFYLSTQLIEELSSAWGHRSPFTIFSVILPIIKATSFYLPRYSQARISIFCHGLTRVISFLACNICALWNRPSQWNNTFSREPFLTKIRRCLWHLVPAGRGDKCSREYSGHTALYSNISRTLLMYAASNQCHVLRIPLLVTNSVYSEKQKWLLKMSQTAMA